MRMNVVDWVAIAVIALSALAGLRRGLVASLFSLAGLVVGALLGSRFAPGLFGDGSGFIPIGALGGAAVGSFIGQMLGGMVGGWARSSLWIIPPLRLLDAVAGLVLGAATGLALVWIAGTVLLYIPGNDEWRRTAQESKIVSKLTTTVTAQQVMDALGRIDPYLTLVGPSAGVPAPDPAIARNEKVRAARGSVVRIRGLACGAGIEGSGWIAGPGLVVTNAHVAAGIKKFVVDRGGGMSYRGVLVAFDPEDDVAVLRVAGLHGRALAFGDSRNGESAASLGFPGNGPFTLRAARVGRTAKVTSRDAYGRVRLGREVVVFRGEVHGGSSGGPLVDARGRVAATIFARRRGTDDGYAIPNRIVRDALRSVGARPVTSHCTGS
jgi:S1-C subfamily serine protease